MYSSNVSATLPAPSPTAAVRVGVSSWSDPEFIRAGWYPPGLSPGRRLDFYAHHFDLVELNSSFYALPQVAQAQRWVEQTPAGFVMDVKCHRLLSRHATRPEALPAELRGDVETTDRGNVVLTPALEAEVADALLAAVAPLEAAGKLGALLLQLTPSFSPQGAELESLEGLLGRLRHAGPGQPARRVVVELRHRGWLSGTRREQTAAFLTEAGVTLAGVDGPPEEHDGGRHPTIMPTVDVITEPRLAYLRLHGRDPVAYLTGKSVAERFKYDYSDAELAGVAARVEALTAQADEVHVLFNNNHGDYAPKAAERFRRLLGQEVTALPPVTRSTKPAPTGRRFARGGQQALLDL